MELISTDDFFILQHLQRSETSLWVCRKTGRFSVRPPWDLAAQENPECLGLVWGLYGKLDIHPDVCERLVLVKKCDRVGEVPGPRLKKHAVYRVSEIVLVPLAPPAAAVAGEMPLAQQLGLKPCPKHHGGIIEYPDFTDGGNANANQSSSKIRMAKLGGSFKLATDTFKNTAGNAAFALLPSQVKAPWRCNNANVSKTVERFERRILEEFSKMFVESESFYFSLTGDVTNALQRQLKRTPVTSTNAVTGEQVELFPTWRDVDDRFFFNKSMVQELIELNDQRLDAWITPFIQGYVEIRECPLNLSDTDDMLIMDTTSSSDQQQPKLPDFYTVALISRRSRHRAGTRYKRRGVDFEGHVANYVETEQILVYHHYALSFLQVRGSVPVHWSQPGIRYRPPPRLDANPEEDKAAFAKHFDQELDIYGKPINCISLVEKTGREKVVADAYIDNALVYDSADLNFVCFDFHDYCRGMHFENVSILTDALEDDMIRAMRYCWLDRHGVVCTQQGVFRINCIDCLDRTNVVQTAIAKSVLETQLTKLGLIPPEQGLPDDTRGVFQGLWANNGDALSKQYAGTNALKGDFTRTGERNFSGLMKDGMNSASRYYLNQFRDAYRQATIDIITGQIVSESLMSANPEDTSQFYGDEAEEEDHTATAEHVKSIIEDCKKLLIPDVDGIVGAWGLIDNDPVAGDPSQEDMDIIVILTKDSYYIAHYDDEVDKVTDYQRVALADIERIEFGVPDQPTFQLSFRQQANKNEHSLRINYRMPPPSTAVFYDAEDASTLTMNPPPASLNNTPLSGFFHMFRTTNLRFFNNMAIVIKTDEERIECLKSVSDSLIVAMELAGLPPAPLFHGRMEKRRSKVPDVHSNFNAVGLASGGPGGAARAVSSSLRALSNVTSQFSKLNPISKLRQAKAKGQNVPDICLEGDMTEAYTKQGGQAKNLDPSCDAMSDSAELSSGPSSLPARPSTLCEPQATSGRTTPTILINQGAAVNTGGKKRLSNLLSPLVSPSHGHSSSTSRLPSLLPAQLSPNLNSRRNRKLSKSSEDVSTEDDESCSKTKRITGNFLGVTFDSTGDLRMKGGGSLQKDLDIATQALEDGAVEATAIIEKGVLNPFAKLTKGLGAVLGNKQDRDGGGLQPDIQLVGPAEEQVQEQQSSTMSSRSSSSAHMMADQQLRAKLAESTSRTKVMLL